jgi:catechol 2,3-dioxygenase-like lactoylglutathione lyase family enzyme
MLRCRDARHDPGEIAAAFRAAHAECEWFDAARGLELHFSGLSENGAVNPGDRRALFNLVRWLKPKRALEIGSSVGGSTTSIALALRLNPNDGGAPCSFTTVDKSDVTPKGQCPPTKPVAAPMPSLENLRKQAKLVLRWHRDRYYPVAAQIRAMLPRYRHLSGAEILARSFKLGDAQELIARQHGFETWQALKAGTSTMQDQAERTTSRAVLTAAEPQVFVADIKASCDFFTEKLGFSVVFVYGEPPFYGQVNRDAARLNLRCLDRPLIDRELVERESLLAAAVTVESADEIKQLYLEFQAASVAFHQTLQRQPWGARDFIVRDPDGNLLLFAGPAE